MGASSAILFRWTTSSRGIWLSPFMACRPRTVIEWIIQSLSHPLGFYRAMMSARLYRPWRVAIFPFFYVTDVIWSDLNDDEWWMSPLVSFKSRRGSFWWVPAAPRLFFSNSVSFDIFRTSLSDALGSLAWENIKNMRGSCTSANWSWLSPLQVTYHIRLICRWRQYSKTAADVIDGNDNV